MTNKTKLLPCPCCEGEAKEMYTYLTSVEWVACLKCGLETKGFGNAEAAAKAWNTRAAPAEDVRAVVEEPVGYALDSMLKRIKDNPSFGHMIFGSPNGAYDVPLYRHPKRPIGYRVRFFKEPENWMVAWNPLPADLNPHCEYQLLYACLDAVEELNK